MEVDLLLWEGPFVPVGDLLQRVLEVLLPAQDLAEGVVLVLALEELEPVAAATAGLFNHL